MSKIKDLWADFAEAKEQCIPMGICVECKQPAEPRIFTPAGQKEYAISGLCERCFDHLFGEAVWPYHYLLTGSSVYGEQRAESDIDICLNSYDADKLKLWLNEHNIKWNYLEISETHPQYADLPTQTYYFKIGGLFINIISLLTPQDMLAWEYATKQLKKIPAMNKSTRKDVFNGFIDAYLIGTVEG